nr:hypothetical protein [Tanacetum cinerariifolium]
MAQNIDFSGSDQIQTPQYPDVHPPSQEKSEEVSQAREDLMKSIETFLEKFNCIPFEEKPPILLQAWDHPIFLNDNEEHSVQNKESLENSSKEIATSKQKQKMKDTMLELVKSCRQKDLLCIHDNVDDLIESTLNTKLLLINSQRLEKEQQEVKKVVEQPVEQPEYSSSMGYENSNTTLETESDEIIKSGVEELVSILSENEVTLEDKRECDVPISKNSTIYDDHSEIFSDSKNDDDISSDNDDFEDVEYVEALLLDPEIVSGVEGENFVHQEEKEVDLEDISQIQDNVLRKKLLSITRLISNIESLNENPTLDLVLNSSVSIPIFEGSDNSLLDNFSPEFETFCDHTEETRSGNTTTHANDSLPEYDSFYFEIEPDQERLINNDIPNDSSNDPLLEEADLFLASDNSIPPVPLPPSEPPDAEFDAGKEIPVVMNDNDEDVYYSSFILVIYPEMFPLLLSAESEDTIFDPEGDIRFLEDLLIDDSILYHESSDSNFDNPPVTLPPPEPPDKEFDFEIDFGDEISVVRNTIVKFECIDAKEFPPVIEVFLCWIFVPVSKIFISFY